MIYFIIGLSLIGGLIKGFFGFCLGGLIGLIVYGVIWIYKDTHPNSSLWHF